jgi:DNA polymerase-3 subunit epsilon
MSLAQRSFEDLGTPLTEVTFCVLDLETTGGSPAESAITEVGAVKVKMGEVVGTFHTLVNPGEPVPAFIRLLTGITDEALIDAPPIGTVLPSLLEFVRGTVVVAHNARFDVSFINAALARGSYPPLDNRVVDTAALARKILAGEVPNNKLATLARFLRCTRQPTHRAYDDALATVEVLHCLIERAAGYGVTTLEDLVAMSATRIDGTFNKIRLAEGVPRGAGVYRFLGASGQTLYVGKATDLRSRVRSYFYGDPRRKMRDLLRETQDVKIEQHATMLEAEVAEARAIVQEMPPYNRSGKKTGAWYLKVTVRGKHPKVSPSRTPKEDGGLYLGPFVSMRAVRTLQDAVRDGISVHRCTDPARCKGCAFAELGTCDGSASPTHKEELHRLVSSIVYDPRLVLERIHARMVKLASQQRFEEAAETRERGARLQRALEKMIECHSLLDAGDLVLGIGQRAVLLRRGRLAAATFIVSDDTSSAVAHLLQTADEVVPHAVSAEARSEISVISSWLARNCSDVRLLYANGSWVSPARARPNEAFAAKKEVRTS